MPKPNPKQIDEAGLIELVKASVRDLKTETGQTQYDLADALGVNQSAISQAVNGVSGMNALRIRILQHLGYSVEAKPPMYRWIIQEPQN